jgi:hypothetical protein
VFTDESLMMTVDSLMKREFEFVVPITLTGVVAFTNSDV